MARKEVQESLHDLLFLLKKEKEEDLAQYKKKMVGTSLKERRKQGVCWYPVKMERSKYNAGDRLIIKINRMEEHREGHLFQSGKLVSFFSNGANNNETSASVNGVVNQVNKATMVVTLNSASIPSWLHDGQLGIQLLFDESSYREMEYAVNQVVKIKSGRVHDLKHILLGKGEAHFKQRNPVEKPGLNSSQNRALNLIHTAQDVAFIHGPPGTGKTTTLIQTILNTLRTEQQILVCAPSNAAVDLLADRLGKQGVEVLRIGHPARVTDEILNKTLDVKITKHPEFKNLKHLRKKSEELFALGKKYKRNFGAAEREKRRQLLNEAKQYKSEADQLTFYISNNLVARAQIIATTLVGASNKILKGLHFKTVFIDEAAQALEPACWIPILKADRVIFAGDHCQLPPTIKSLEAARGGLEKTLFEKGITNNQSDVLLREQYRMHNDIMTFSSRVFYKNKLRANEQVAHWKIFDGDAVVEFIDTAGCGYFEQRDKESRSSFNKEEADLLIRHLIQYLGQIEAVEKLDSIENIGIISPYKAQITLLQEMLEAAGLEEEVKDKIGINTVDSFQGQERDIVYISLVRSNDNGEIGFLSDRRRMNVAMTRARKKLVIIGDSATIGQNKFYNELLDYMSEIGAYRSAFEIME